MTTFAKTDLAAHVRLTGSLLPLALLATLRFVALEDLEAAGASRDEIAALAESGHVFRLSLQRWLTSTARTEVIALRRKGAVALAEGLGADADSIPSETASSCRRSAMFLDHCLARSRFALILALALRESGGPALLSWEQEPERLADEVMIPEGPGELARQPLVADGLAVLRGPRGDEGLLVEVDRGTERPGYLGRKYRGYLEWWRGEGPRRRFGLNALRVLTVAPDDRRVGKLLGACVDATESRAKGLFWFANEEEVAREGILSPVWHTMASGRLPLWH